MSFSERLEGLLRVAAMVILKMVGNERCLVKVAEQHSRGLDSLALCLVSQMQIGPIYSESCVPDAALDDALC